jgi:predicted nucleic acid-binding Zn ribbon protein
VDVEGWVRTGPGKRQPIRRNGDPTRVAASLQEAAQLIGAEGAVELAVLRRHWARAAGSQVAAHAWPAALERGVLTVATDHHAWAVELRLLSAELLGNLQVPCPSVQAIAVRVSPREGQRW